MHLERASYEELQIIKAKLDERMLHTTPTPLKDLMELIEQGRMLDAVKMQRQQTGMGLKESKDYVDDLKKKMTIIKDITMKEFENTLRPPTI